VTLVLVLKYVSALKPASVRTDDGGQVLEHCQHHAFSSMGHLTLF
jgi:hypothetical protein